MKVQGFILLLFFQMQMLANLFGQDDHLTMPVTTENIIPPVPETGALTKFGAYPVGLYTGTPHVNIDLYTLKTKHLSVPLSLNYSSNGVKVDEIATRVGMTWTLNAGGVISRTVYDKADDTHIRTTPPPSYNFANPTDQQLGWLSNIITNHMDTQFDEYDYNFNGVTGKFYIDLNNHPILYPYSNLRIEYTLPSQASDWIFRITTPDAVQYYFGENGAAESTEVGSGGCSRESSNGAKNAWYLTKIKYLNDPTDSITFSYISSGYTYTSHINHTVTYFLDQSCSSNPSCGCGPTPCIYGSDNDGSFLGGDVFCISQEIVSSVLLSKITSSLWGNISFSYTTKPDIGTNSLLDTIRVYQNSNGTGLLQEFRFNYADVVPNSSSINVYANELGLPVTSRPFLTSLQNFDKNESLVKTYSFQYNDMNNLPPRLSFNQDYWGYYNGASNYNSFIPVEAYGAYPNLSPAPKTAVRTVDYTYAVKGMLSQVNFPTGGYTKFIYEGNAPSQADHTLDLAGAGVRVKQQVVYDPVSGQSTTTNYQYSNMVIPYSPLYVTPITIIKAFGFGSGDNTSCNLDPTATKSCDYAQFSSNSAINMYGEAGTPVLYKQVTESIGDNYVVGGTEHFFTYWVDPGINILFANPIPSIATPSYNWKNGADSITKVFKVDSNGNKIYLKKTFFSYTDDARINLIDTQVVVIQHWDNQFAGGASLPQDTDLVKKVYYLESFDINSYNIQQQWRYLSSKQEINYDINGANPLSDTTNYFYDNPTHTLVTRTLNQNSRGQPVETLKKYPADSAIITNLTSSESQAIHELLGQNNQMPVLESEYYVDSNLQNRVHAGYKDWGSGILNPESIKTQTLNNPIESRVQFQHYDANGNLVTQSKTNDFNTSYVWDYKKCYPIAEVKNADSGSFAYTSFEADGSGNWTIGMGTLDTTTSVTGNNSFNISGSGNISKSGLDSTRTYIVSYWTKNSSAFSVTGTIAGYPVKGKTINGWTLYVHRVTGRHTILVADSGYIDELRLYPLGAQMTTFTYSPLIGITSQTDIGNHTTYYEYDGLERLKRIRDQDHNILKSLDYQYQAPSGCGPNCFIEPMQTLAGTNTLGYPVGVFNVHGQLLGNVAGPATFVSLWNTDTADAHVGTLATGADSLHFQITLNTGKSLLSITGCRYYQVDLHWNKLDGVRNLNGAYVDFGDGTGMHLGKTLSDTPAIIASNTTYGTVFGQDRGAYETYFVHTYSTGFDTSRKTLTLYHNDANESEDFDNLGSSPTGLKTLTNLRGSLPQNTDYIGGSSYQQPGMTSIDSIYNWSSIHNIHGFRLNDGDGVDPCQHIHYPQDFLAGNQQLDTIFTGPSYYSNGVRDTSFKISRLKSDWNTYFTHLRYLDISDRDWNREDLSPLKELTVVQVTASTSNDLDDTGSPLVTIPSSEIDAILNQVAAGAGVQVHNGFIFIDAGGPIRTTASDASVRLLKEKGWQIQVNRITQ